MSNDFFKFKKFIVKQDRCAMKVTTDGCLFGAFVGEKVGGSRFEVGHSENPHILDIGAGTGLLTLMVAQKVNALFDAIEIDKNAYEQAIENIAGSPWKNTITMYHGDATDFKFPHKYDLIISNPPFYENELKSPDRGKNLAHHGGMTLNNLFQTINANLSENGSFFLLLPYKRNTEIDKLIASNKLSIIEKTLVRQSVNHDYFRIMIHGNQRKSKPPPLTDEISIWNAKQQYTQEFKELLKDYYLAL